MPCHRLYSGLNPCGWRLIKRHENEQGWEFMLSLAPKRLCFQNYGYMQNTGNAAKNILCFHISRKNTLLPLESHVSALFKHIYIGLELTSDLVS